MMIDSNGGYESIRGGEDEAVQAALVDNGQATVGDFKGRVSGALVKVPVLGILNNAPVLLVNVVQYRLSHVAVPQRRRHVPADKPRLAVNGYRADVPKFGIVESLNVVHGQYLHIVLGTVSLYIPTGQKTRQWPKKSEIF